MPPKKKTTARRAPTPSSTTSAALKASAKANSVGPASPSGRGATYNPFDVVSNGGDSVSAAATASRAESVDGSQDSRMAGPTRGGGKKVKGRGKKEREMDVDEEQDASADEATAAELAAIEENYELETSARTQSLRDRIQKDFLSTLRLRFSLERSRLTPLVSHVTAGEHMIRDGGSLRKTTEVAARDKVEQGLRIGEGRGKRRLEEEGETAGEEAERMGLTMSEVEKSARKRKRTHAPQANGRHASHEEVDGSFVVVPRAGPSPTKKGKGKAVDRGASGRPSRTARTGASPARGGFNWTASSTSAGFLNPHLPQTPSLHRAAGTDPSTAKQPRPARRNESLISANGSPVLAANVDDEDYDEDGDEADGMELEPLRLNGTHGTGMDVDSAAARGRSGHRRVSSGSSAGGKASASKGKTGKGKLTKAGGNRRGSRSRSRDSIVAMDGPEPSAGQNGRMDAPTGQFTFKEASRWKELEEQLMSTDMDGRARVKLQEMLAQLKMTEMAR